MSVGIRLTDVPSGGYRIQIVNPWNGWWLASYDPEAHDGIGRAEFVEDPAGAIRFESEVDAKAYWLRRSDVAPTIEVGGREVENRPLAVMSISVEPLPAR